MQNYLRIRQQIRAESIITMTAGGEQRWRVLVDCGSAAMRQQELETWKIAYAVMMQAPINWTNQDRNATETFTSAMKACQCWPDVFYGNLVGSCYDAIEGKYGHEYVIRAWYGRKAWQSGLHWLCNCFFKQESLSQNDGTSYGLRRGNSKKCRDDDCPWQKHIQSIRTVKANWARRAP